MNQSQKRRVLKSSAKKKTQKKSHMKFHVIILSAAFFFILIYLLTGPRGTIKYLQIYLEKEEMIDEIENLEKEKARLDSVRKRALNDQDYIEKIAREQYNMKKEGEKVYKIIREKE
ncbi:MAG: hypothetical protein GF313_09270 [Caldithrix sp.]|nr:hypothetical protein [Caldithrix sp.]